MSFEVQGLSALQEQLVELGAELGRKALAQAARKAFKPVLENAKQLAPRDTGALAESLRLAVVKPKGGDTVIAVGIRVAAVKGASRDAMPPARRWHFIELGTVKLAAHPFLRPALDANASRVLDDLKRELAKSIQRAIKKKGASK